MMFRLWWQPINQTTQRLVVLVFLKHFLEFSGKNAKVLDDEKRLLDINVKSLGIVNITAAVFSQAMKHQHYKTFNTRWYFLVQFRKSSTGKGAKKNP